MGAQDDLRDPALEARQFGHLMSTWLPSMGLGNENGKTALVQP